MRKIAIAIAAAAGAVGLMIAAAPASALSTYQIQTDGGANLDGTPNAADQSKSGFSMTTRTSADDNSSAINPDGTPNVNFGATNRTQQQNNLSGDMGWQGTGYYLRPNN
ncbi:MAG TPA: hypothetical protein VGN05_12935 [Parvibaculum sp.]|jgi:hypothetical protein